MTTIKLNGENLSIDSLVRVSREKQKVEISSKGKITKSRKELEKFLNSDKPIYGVNTGFGALADKRISKEDLNILQENLIMSHAAALGKPLPEEIVRAILALRINNLARGYSGVRLETVQTLVEMLNKDVLPIIPEKGSVGASGDLAQLAHIALVLTGYGEATYKGQRMNGIEAMTRAEIKPIRLEAKEGLALVNGTQVMTAIAALTVHDAKKLAKNADIAAAMSLEALQGTAKAFDAKIHRLRNHQGQKLVAKNLRNILKQSEILKAHKHCTKIQDAYSLRCVPQVHGASRDAINYAWKTIAIEINSVTDNPIIYPNEVISGGNFHGQPIAIASDILAIAIAELANISEARIERLVNPKLSGLPAFLIEDNGLNSGLMIAQYTAASLVSENKSLAHPASVDSIPTSANQEDHVSMGTIAARKAREILYNAQNVIGIEFLCAAQALEFNKSQPGLGTRKAYQAIRKKILELECDGILYKDINKAYSLVVKGKILEEVEKSIGKMQ